MKTKEEILKMTKGELLAYKRNSDLENSRPKCSGCFKCSVCTGCSGCYDCTDCSDCSVCFLCRDVK